MIVSVRNWTALTLPRKAVRRAMRISRLAKPAKAETRKGFFGSWQELLETQADLMIRGFDQK